LKLRKLINKNQTIFSIKHFQLNAYKQNYHFEWKKSSSFISEHPQKRMMASLTQKEIYLQFFESTVIGESYKELSQIKFFLCKEKESDKKKFHFMPR